MERDFKKELSNFDRVWQKVSQGKGKLPAGLKLMPEKESRERCRRRCRGR